MCDEGTMAEYYAEQEWNDFGKCLCCKRWMIAEDTDGEFCNSCLEQDVAK